MRQLTQQEVDDAPSWATHYAAEGHSINWRSQSDFGYGSHVMNTLQPIPERYKPIPRKEGVL